MKKVISLLLFMSIGLIFSMSFPINASACKCVEVPPVESEFTRSHAVFSGEVIAVKKQGNLKGYWTKSVLFEVKETWKGVKQSQVIIATGQSGGDCGIDFIVGQDYLVYANESDMYGAKSLTTTICDRTNDLSASQEDIEFLGEGKPPSEPVDLMANFTANQDGNSLFNWIAAFLVLAILVFVFNIRKRR